MKKTSPYLKMRVLGAIDYARGKTIRDRIKDVAETPFIDEEGNQRRFTWRTVGTWYYRYKKDGITGVETKRRADKGTTRKTAPEELLEAINQALPSFRKGKHTKMDIYRKIIEKGLIKKENLAQTTFFRFVKEYELLSDSFSESNKKRLAFSMRFANELWQGDTMFGPFVVNEKGKPTQTKLIAFIDDASRVLCHGQFFFNENTDSLVTALKQAFYKRGVPEQLYVDNGSIYTCQEITLVCARLGCVLRHAPLRDGAAKGKIERFFRTVRLRFLSRELGLSSLNALNLQFHQWVEDEYNARKHSAIGLKPIDRFNFDLKRVRFLAPNETNDELFYAESSRKVKKDNTFSFNSNRYEAPAHLRDKTVQVRFDRHDKDKVIVYYKNARLGRAREVDLIANAYLRNKKGKNYDS